MRSRQIPKDRLRLHIACGYSGRPSGSRLKRAYYNADRAVDETVSLVRAAGYSSGCVGVFLFTNSQVAARRGPRYRRHKAATMSESTIMINRERQIVEANLRLGRAEYRLNRSYLRSMPRTLGLVLGNACNIDCPHCYQEKNADNLLRPADIGRQFRRELLSLYPYLSALRVQGGEALAYSGFRELVDDVASVARRPLLSISTNGTLIDDEWAERMARLPFSSVTISIDGATPETYARLRRGSELRLVLANVARIRRWKQKLDSPHPALDSFFVILRSNFREIPQYLQLVHDNGFSSVALQIAEINATNTRREPLLAKNEVIEDPHDVAELYAVMRDSLPRARRCFRTVLVSGLRTLFEKHGYDASFLLEQENGLYPASDDLASPSPRSSGDSAETDTDRRNSGDFELCPNPWTTLFVAENGDVHLCFLSEPVGNVYEAPLVEIWNSPRAVAKRLRMIQGRYIASGCSGNWCSWREGKPAPPLNSVTTGSEWERDIDRGCVAANPFPISGEDSVRSELTSVRRMLAENNRRLKENGVRLKELERAVQEMDEEFQRMRRSVLVRAAAHLARKWDRLRGRQAERPGHSGENSTFHPYGGARIEAAAKPEAPVDSSCG